MTHNYQHALPQVFLPKMFGVAFICLTFAAARADTARTQTINLHTGWNAVYLQVTPSNAAPNTCFQGTPVTIAALYGGNGSSVQYIQNPNTNTITQNNGWTVWYAPSRPDAFLTSFFALNANTALLLYSQSNYVWSVTGTAALGLVTWKPNSFNLAGFALDPRSPPTFDQFFSASPAHQPYRIYRLANDQWVQVANAKTTQMLSGEACWIYCTGSSAYQGPLTVQLQSGSSALVNGTDLCGILLANNTANPLNVTMSNPTSRSVLPLAFLLNAVTPTNVFTGAYDLPATYNMPTFEASEKRGFWLALRPELMTTTNATTLLEITTDIGTQYWLPVTANQSEL